MATAPVIIMGMHRSGTSLLTRILEELGLFMGVVKDVNAESEFFLGLNRWIFGQVNATWDNPYCFRFLNEYMRDVIVAALDQFLKDPSRQYFIGADKMASIADIRNLDIPWGWKDPRNAFTAEIWQRLFPNARIIHIYRNPIDVAASLRNREIDLKTTTQKLFSEQGIVAMLNKKTQFQLSVRVENVDEGIKLWEEYNEKALSLDHAFEGRLLHLRYEDFLEQPVSVLTEVVRFCGLTVSEDEISSKAAAINVTRKYAFTNNPELVEIYRRWQNRELFKRLGYNEIISTKTLSL